MDPLVLEMAQKVVKSVDQVRPYSPVAFVQQPAEMTECKPGICEHLTCLRKQPQQRQTGELLATMHTHMDCLIMYPRYGSEIGVRGKRCAWKTPSYKSAWSHM